MLFNGSYSKNLSFSDWNWSFDRRNHLTIFWQTVTCEIFEIIWGSLQKRLKLVSKKIVHLEKGTFLPLSIILLLEKKASWKIWVCEFNICPKFRGSKDVVESKLKGSFELSFIVKNWGKKKRGKNSIFLLFFNPQMRFSVFKNKT